MQRPKINRIWTGNSPMMRRDPGDAKYQQGWVSEIPTYQVLNYLQYKIDTTILAQAERGIAEWGDDVAYGLGSLAWDNKTNYIYVSLVQQPDRNKAPSDNAAHWGRSSIQITRKEFDDIVAAISAHIANKANPHNLTAGQLNAYNKQEMDNLVAQYRALVAAHVNDKNNPHNTTAAQAGGVPITGGTYEGDVKFLKSIGLNAGDTARLCNENGIYLEIGPHNSDVALIGINTAGEVVAGRSQSKSPIVTEKTFQDLKATNEPNYAVPLPAISMNLMNSLNIQVGAGELEFDQNKLEFAANGWLIRRTGKDIVFQTTADSRRLDDDYTVVARMRMSEFDANASGFPLIFGLYEAYTGITSSGSVHYNNRASMAGNIGGKLVAGQEHTIAMSSTWNGNITILRIFLDGVQIGYVSNQNRFQGRQLAAIVRGDATFAGEARISNLRIWTECLTPAQVSTL